MHCLLTASYKEKMCYADSILKEKWNSLHENSIVSEEQFWEICRIFENAGYAEGNRKTVGINTIGPFKIINKDFQRKEILTYFLQVIIPAFMQKMTSLQFEEFYAIYLIPLIQIFIGINSNFTFIKDELSWEILLYLKRENENNKYPTLDDLKKDEFFREHSVKDINNAFYAILNMKTVIGDSKKILEIDKQGRISCNY